MEASVVLNILVRQVVTMPPELGIGFTELSHQISIEEGIKEGTVIKVFELDQNPNPGLKIDCEIMRVSDDKGKLRKELFEAKFNDKNQCELIVKGILDKEEGVESFEAMVKLITQSAFANPARMISTVSYYLKLLKQDQRNL